MYYSTILNPELAYFHKLPVPNFTIKLSDVLHKTSGAFDNKLFLIEEIITDTLYRVYPMFYTGTISSSNPSDNIIDDKVLICQKLENETYITFISDENEPIQDYQSYATYYEIGDSLTEAQFNSIVALLRHNTVFNDSFRLNENVAGGYANYEFSLDGVSFFDNGIVVTDETISAEPKVRMTKPVFRWAKYTLVLTVLRITGANIGDDDEDLTETETIEVILSKNEWVDIPMSDVEADDIILFDVNVRITFDVPEIHRIIGIEVNAEPSVIQSGESTDIYATILDTDGEAYDINDASGKTVYFFEKLTPTLTVSAEPNIIQSEDTLEIYCSVRDEDGSKAKGVTVYFYKEGGGSTASLSLVSDKSVLSYADSESATLTATYSGGSGATVQLYDSDDTLIGTMTDNDDGTYSYTYASTGVGDVGFYAKTGDTVSSTVSIEDCNFFNTLTDSSADAHLIRTGITCSYTSNGLAVTNGNWKDLVFDIALTQGMCVEYDITAVGGSQSPKFYAGLFSDYSQGNTGITNYQPNATGHIKMVYQNDTVQTWLNDTLMTDNDSSSTNPTVTTEPVYYKVSTGGQRTFTIKNLKIKSI